MFEKTYQSKEFLKKNFTAKWTADKKIWLVDVEKFNSELDNCPNYYQVFIVNAERTEEKVVVKKNLSIIRMNFIAIHILITEQILLLLLDNPHQNHNHLSMICPLSSRQYKYLKSSVDETCISLWGAGIFLYTPFLFIVVYSFVFRNRGFCPPIIDTVPGSWYGLFHFLILNFFLNAWLIYWNL